MATTYYLLSSDSDLTGGEAFTKDLGTIVSGATTVSIDESGQNDSYGFTTAGVPGAAGETIASYEVSVDITTGSTNGTLYIAVARVNSSGVVQATSSETAGQTTTAGIKTFSLADVDLGTWSAGDRLRVYYKTIGSGTMARATYDIAVNDTDTFVTVTGPASAFAGMMLPGL